MIDGLPAYDAKQLVRRAAQAMEHSYSPYSRFRVGAALLAKSSTVYCGCNIENAAFSVTNCAERTALFKAISEGERGFTALAVIARGEGPTDYCTPCGVCRQALSEFCGPDFPIILAKTVEDFQVETLGVLLARSFTLRGDERNG